MSGIVPMGLTAENSSVRLATLSVEVFKAMWGVQGLAWFMVGAESTGVIRVRFRLPPKDPDEEEERGVEGEMRFFLGPMTPEEAGLFPAQVVEDITHEITEYRERQNQ